MKIRMTVTLDIDPDAWGREYGVAREDVRADVKSWVASTLGGALDDVVEQAEWPVVR